MDIVKSFGRGSLHAAAAEHTGIRAGLSTPITRARVSPIAMRLNDSDPGT